MPASSRQEEAPAPVSVQVSGASLVRYRLALAAHLDRAKLLRAGRSLSRPVVFELVVVLSGGRVLAVDVQQDGGAPAVAAEARRALENAVRAVPVPEEFLGETLRVAVALWFEPGERAE